MGTEVRSVSSTGGQKGVKEERGDLIPVGPLRELATHFGRGALKYDVHQWRQGYEWSKSYSALMRHLNLFWGGEDYDVCSNEPENCLFEHPEDGRPWPKPDTDTCWNHTGSHHMVAVAWHSFVLLEFKDRFPEFDDRFKVEKATEDDRSDIRRWLTHSELMSAFWSERLAPNPDPLYWVSNPDPLYWVSKATGEKQPVCLHTDTEKQEQGSIEKHYLEIHGIRL